ncbi:DUF11 domain-containing protein [bacterium]|nr:MAG: DUF11 domain-containing protein [bacterium]
MQKFLKKESTKKFFSTLAILSLITPGVLLQVPYQQAVQAAGVAAGTVIGNQATAKYKDGNNNSYNSTSNLVSTTVANVWGVTLTPNGTVTTPGQSQNATAGAIVYYPYVLTNNGNGADTFNITSTVDASSAFDPTTTKEVYYDANGNGIVDVGDSKINDGSPTVSVPADGSIKLIVKYQVPSGATTGSAFINLVANSVGDTTELIIDGDGKNNTTGLADANDYNYNRTTIVNDAVVTVTKSVDKASANPSSDLTYNFNLTNTGNQDADEIIIVDAIPKYSVFKVGSATFPSGVEVTYSQYAEDDATTANRTNFTYVPAPGSTGYDPLVKRVRYRMASALTGGSKLAPANTRSLSFIVRINDNAPAVTVANAAEFMYKNNANAIIGDNGGSPDTTVNDITDVLNDTLPDTNTNTATTIVNKKSASQISFNTPTFEGTTFGADTNLFPAFNSDRTTIETTPAGTYIYYRNQVTNKGNAADTFNIQLDPQSRLISGAIVNFFIETSASSGSSNTSPLLDTNNDGIPDTSSIPGVNPGTGITGGTSSTYNIVTRVFIPANASQVLTGTTTSAASTGATVPLTSVNNVNIGDSITIGSSSYKIINISGNNVTLDSAPAVIATGTTVSIKASVAVVVRATSTNGGTAIAATPGLNLSDTTANLLTSITAPSVKLFNIVAGAPESGVAQVTLTQSASGATVSYPLNVKNDGSSSDTFNLTYALGSPALPAGSTVLFYPLMTASTTTVNDTTIASTDNEITLTSVAGYAVGDNIIINGKTLTVAAINGNTITFAPGQTLGAGIVTGATVTERGASPITSTNLIGAGLTQQVIAVVTVPSTAAVNTYPISFTSTSTNNSGVSSTINDQLLVPQFKTFTLEAPRTGSIPPGGVLFYTHTITNTGNTPETFNLTLPTTANGLSYQLLDNTTGAVLGTVTAGNNTYTTPSIAQNGTFVFRVKVTAPGNSPANTVSSVVVSAQESTTLETKTNTDVTTVVEGFVSLSKAVAVWTYGTNGLVTGATPSTLITGATTVKPGEVLEYTITYTNIGSQNATEVSINDLIPANTTYVPGSLVINNVVKSDADDVETDAASGSAKFVAATGTTFNVGTGATQTVGGIVSQGATGTVKFRVRVNP